MGKPLGQLAAHREFLAVGDAVDPQRARPDHPGEQNAEEPRRRPGRNHHMRAKPQHFAQGDKAAPGRAQRLVLVAIGQRPGVGDAALARQIGLGRQIAHGELIERGRQQHHLLPVSAARCDGENPSGVILHVMSPACCGAQIPPRSIGPRRAGVNHGLAGVLKKRAA